MRWTFFAGLGVGTAIGMLVAPKSGFEVREDIGDFARNSLNREKLNEVLDGGRARMQRAVEHGREQVQNVRDKIEPVVENARERARDAAEPVIRNLRENLDKASEKVADLKEKTIGPGLLTVLNDWSYERLIAIDGIGPVLASKVIQHRPYESEDQLANLKDLPPSAIENLRKAA